MSQNLVIHDNNNGKNSVEKTRNAILMLRNSSPTLRERLRERCEKRIQDHRFNVLNKFRQMTLQGEVKSALSNILVEEWKNMDTSEDSLGCYPIQSIFSSQDKDIELEEILQKELISFHEDWLQQQCGLLLQEEANESIIILCPLCKKERFETECLFDKCMLRCYRCNVQFSTSKTLSEVNKDIFDILNLHNSKCNWNLEFGTVPDNQLQLNLYAFCRSCGFEMIVL